MVDRRELIVSMQPSATAADVAAVRRSLEAMVDVASIRFVDRAAAYAEMKVLFADPPLIGARLDGRHGVLNIAYPGE